MASHHHVPQKAKEDANVTFNSDGGRYDSDLPIKTSQLRGLYDRYVETQWL